MLASSEKCHVQSIVKYYDGDIPGFTHGSKLPPEPYRSVHIISLQGHAEWSGKHVILPLVDGESGSDTPIYVLTLCMLQSFCEMEKLTSR